MKFFLPSVCCYDDMGHRVELGQRYIIDGCNSCICGFDGKVDD
jgi:hypothetical protein